MFRLLLRTHWNSLSSPRRLLPPPYMMLDSNYRAAAVTVVRSSAASTRASRSSRERICSFWAAVRQLGAVRTSNPG
jgi:hypothetical protein